MNLILGPAVQGASVRFRVFVDGQPAVQARGTDLDDKAEGSVTDQRLYQLVRQTGAIQERLFGIEFLDPGVDAYCFTFG